MTQIRLYLDEDVMCKALVVALRAQGVDVTTAREQGMLARPDEDHLRRAAQLGRVIYTCNARDYSRLHSEFLSRGDSHAGIAILSEPRCSVGEQLRRLTGLIGRVSLESMKNALEYV